MITSLENPVLKPEIADFIQAHIALVGRGLDALKEKIRLGGILADWQENRIPEGQWCKWIKENLPIDERTVERYIATYGQREKLLAKYQEQTKLLLSGSTEDKKRRPKRSSPRELCPTCGRPMTKAVLERKKKPRSPYFKNS